MASFTVSPLTCTVTSSWSARREGHVVSAIAGIGAGRGRAAARGVLDRNALPARGESLTGEDGGERARVRLRHHHVLMLMVGGGSLSLTVQVPLPTATVALVGAESTSLRSPPSRPAGSPVIFHGDGLAGLPRRSVSVAAPFAV